MITCERCGTLQCYSCVREERDNLKKALKFARMTINHALYLDYMGGGSTKGMAEEAVQKANMALGDEE